MNEDKLGVSIVVASKGRVKLLGDLLESIYISRQNYSGECEVIIVDDSNEKDAKEIKILCDKYDAKMVYFSPSVSGKRNYGAHLSKYQIVLFLDSDCLATPNLLEEHTKLYSNDKIGGVAGLLKFTGEDTWFWKAVAKSPFVICFGMPAWLETVPWGPTANFSIRKDLFEQLNGFDEEFPNKPGGEDVDLGLRLTKLGNTIRCSKEGLVYHSKKTWIPVKDMFRRLWHYGSADYFLMKKHPDYTVEVLPRRTILYAVMAIVLIVLSIGLKTWVMAAAVPIWILYDICINSIMVNVFMKDKRTSFAKQFVVQILLLTNELGLMARAAQKKEFKYWFKQMVYFDGQYEGILYNGSISAWSLLISMSSIIASIILIKAL